MNNPRMDFLFMRRPAIEYISPPICEVIFSSTGFPVIVFPEFDGVPTVGGVAWVKYNGVFRLTWDAVPGALCYTIYESDSGPGGPFHVIAECLQNPYYDPSGDPTSKTYKIVAITPEGEDSGTTRTGPGTNPDDPGLFGNAPQDVEVECDSGGGTFYYTVPQDTFFAYSQLAADTAAFAAAHDLAVVNEICLDDATSDFCVGEEYLVVVTATGGTPESWSVSLGNLPPGLNLTSDPLTPDVATIEGTPTDSGDYDFTIRCTDPEGNYVEREYHVAGIEITTEADLPDGTGGTPYSEQLEQDGGTEPVSWLVVDGALPPDLTLHDDTGILDGTPSEGGDYTFTVQMTDDEFRVCSKEFHMHVEATAHITGGGGASICAGGAFNVSCPELGINVNGGAADCSYVYLTAPFDVHAEIGQLYTFTITDLSGYKLRGAGLILNTYDAGLQVVINGTPTAYYTESYPYPGQATTTITLQLTYL